MIGDCAHLGNRMKQDSAAGMEQFIHEVAL